MTIDYKKLLPSSMRTTRWGQFMEAIQSVLADIKTDKIEVIENQWNINEVTADQIKIIRDILGYDFLDYDSGWSSNLEYLKRQILTVVPRIENRTTKKAYDYDFYIYNLIGNAYPMYYDEVNKYLHPKTTWQTYDETADDTIIDTLDMVGPTTTQTVNTYTQATYEDWYLPSRDELQLMYDNLASSGIAGFSSVPYWSSSESGVTHAYTIDMGNGIVSGAVKSSTVPYTRSARSFTSTTPYTIGGLGQAEGYVFYKDGNNYMECASSNQATGEVWSNKAIAYKDIAYIDNNINSLRTYRFNGTDWGQIGSGLPITTSTYNALTYLNNTDVVLFTTSSKLLQTYRWGGSNWSSVGNPIIISGTPESLATLNSTDIAYIDYTLDSLRTYRFNGTDWGQIGSGLPITLTGVNISALNSTDIALAFMDSVNPSQLRTYRFDGTNWSQVGSGLAVTVYYTRPYITALNSTDVALTDSYYKTLRTYRFDGTNWSQVGSGLSVPNRLFQLTKLNDYDIAGMGVLSPTLSTYRFDGYTWSQVGNSLSFSTYSFPGTTGYYTPSTFTSTEINSGIVNSSGIVNQSGHTSSAAETTNDYENFTATSVDSTVTINSYTLDTALFPHLDMKHEIDRFTRHILIPYEFRNIDTAGCFQTDETLSCLYEDILYTKRVTEIPHFEPICKANIISGVASTKEYYFDYDVSVSGIVESYYYDSVYTDRLSGIAGIQFGTGSHSAVVVSGVTGVKTPLVYSGLVNGIIWESDLDIINETPTRFNARRNLTQKGKFGSYTEIALLDANSGVVAYATFPQITYLEDKTKFYGNPQVDFNLV